MFADVQGTLMWNVRLEGVVIIAQLQYALVPSVFYLGELLGQFEMSNVASHIFFFFRSLFKFSSWRLELDWFCGHRHTFLPLPSRTTAALFHLHTLRHTFIDSTRGGKDKGASNSTWRFDGTISLACSFIGRGRNEA